MGAPYIYDISRLRVNAFLVSLLELNKVYSSSCQ